MSNILSRAFRTIESEDPNSPIVIVRHPYCLLDFQLAHRLSSPTQHDPGW
jgi:hypothetical protein